MDSVSTFPIDEIVYSAANYPMINKTDLWNADN